MSDELFEGHYVSVTRYAGPGGPGHPPDRQRFQLTAWDKDANKRRHIVLDADGIIELGMWFRTDTMGPWVWLDTTP